MDSKKYIGHYHELFFVVKQNISKVLDKNYLKDGRMEAGKEWSTLINLLRERIEILSSDFVSKAWRSLQTSETSGWPLKAYRYDVGFPNQWKERGNY